jgi:hypothetical protein
MTFWAKLLKIVPNRLFIHSVDFSKKGVTKSGFIRCNSNMRKTRISLSAVLALAVAILFCVFSQQQLIKNTFTTTVWKVSETETKSVSIIAAGKPIWHIIPRLLLTGR